MRSFCLLVFLLAAVSSTRAADGHSTNTVAQADLKKFKLAPGLKAEVVAAEPLLENPVAFSIDGRGRFFIAESHRWAASVFDITANTPWLLDDLSCRTVNDRAAFLARQFATNFAVLTNDSELIRLVEDRDGDGRAETSSVFADGFREATSGTAAGVLAQGTNVWFTSIPDLWRFGELGRSNQYSVTSNQSGNPPPVPPPRNTPLRITDSLTTDLLITGLGVHISVSGHDVHGLIRGHDGRIYFSFGDRGVCVTNREGIVLNVPDTGGVLRCEPDGRNLEIFCTGLRNPQELAFDDYGNLWTVDNDTAGADPCRVLHLVEGGDYGWRISYQHMKGFGPWVSEELWRGGLDGILPPAGTVSQGPAGLAFYPGTGLTPQLAGKFVHADFPGGIWAYSVKPRGASFELADKEKIFWNCWPTDVDFGPDGALYVLDWVESWVRSGKGRIYRLTANDQSPMTKAQLNAASETRRLLGEGMSKRGEKELLALFGHADRRVRLEAQWELAGRGTNSLTALIGEAQNGANQFARVHALWGIRQISRLLNVTLGGDGFASLKRLLVDKDAEVRGQAAIAIGETTLVNDESSLRQLLEDPSLRVRCLAIEAIHPRWGRLNSLRDAMSRFPANAANKPASSEAFAQSIEHLFQTILDRILSPLEGWDRSDSSPVGSKHFGDMQGVDPFLMHGAVEFLSAPHRDDSFESGYLLRPTVPSGVLIIRNLRRHAIGSVGIFLTNQSPLITLEAARAINDAPIPAAYPALAALLEDPRFRDPNWGWSALSNVTPAGPFSANVRPPRDQVLLRALNANFRVGEAGNAEALVRFATGMPFTDAARTRSRRGNEADSLVASNRPPPHVGGYGHLRAEALFLLGAWEVLPAKVGDLSIKPARDPNHGSVPTVNPENWPGWFDRVVGLYRPLPPRPPDAARRALAPQIEALLADTDPEVSSAALQAAVKLRLTNAAPALLALMRSASTPVGMRKQIPDALAALGATGLVDAVKLALAEKDPVIRAAALPHLGSLRSDDAVQILGKIVEAILERPNPANETPAELRLAQAALSALGGLASSEADGWLLAAFKKRLSGQLPEALELELVDAAARRDNAELKSMLATFQAERAKDTVLGAWRSLLTGGDAERGRAIFFEKVEVQCSRCHMVKGQGGTVGPRLDGIAVQRNREYMLESILFPNRSIAAGFENVMLTMKNGAEHSGLVKADDANELTLESPEEGNLRIAKADIVARQRGLSAMPEGLGKALSRRELRDLVEYLSGLK